MKTIAGFAAALLLLAACGSKERPAAPDGGPPASPAATESAAPTPTSTLGGTPSATPGATGKAPGPTTKATSSPAPDCPKPQGRQTPAPGRTTLVAASVFAGSVAMSGDGRYVAFRSDSPTVLPNGEDTNNAQDIFVTDRVEGTTNRVNLTDDGKQADGQSSGVEISADGHWVLFVSAAPNLAGGKKIGRVYLRDLRTGKNIQLPPVDPAKDTPNIIGRSLSADGRWATFEWAEKSYLYDRRTNKTTRIPGYAQAFISGDGSTIVVEDAAGRLATVRDRASGKVETVSLTAEDKKPTSGNAGFVSISDDGNRVAFIWDGPDLAASGCTGPAVYVRDRAQGTTTRVTNAPPNPTFAQISGDGRWIVFNAADTVGGDTQFKAFRYELATGRTTVASVADDESPAAGEEVGSVAYAVSTDGREVAFVSNATNLTPGTDGRENVFVREFD